MRGLTEALDGEWHGYGIKVRDILPGFIETPLLDGVAGDTNRSIRETVVGAGPELTGADAVAEAAWKTVQGKAVHIHVGKTARRLAFAARWMPGRPRNRMKRGMGSGR